MLTAIRFPTDGVISPALGNASTRQSIMGKQEEQPAELRTEALMVRR